MSRLYHSVLFFTLFLVTVTALTTSCESTAPISELTEVERARRIAELRKESKLWFEKFRESEGASDFDALRRHTDLEKETTDLAMGTCPFCFFRYGVALQRLGNFHFRNGLDLGRHDELPPELQKKQNEYFSLARERYRDSIRSLEVFVQQSPRDPEVVTSLFEIMKNYDMIGDYERALVYLDRFREEYFEKLDETSKKELLSIRDTLEKRLYEKEEDQLIRRGRRARRETMGDDEDARLRDLMRRAGREQPAN